MSPAIPPSRASERRRFLKLVGVAGLSTAVHGSLAGWSRAATAPAAAPPPKADTTAAVPTPPSVPPEVAEDARALAAVVGRRYGKFLSARQMEAVTRELESRIQAGKRLRESRLANSDEPDVVFSA